MEKHYPHTAVLRMLNPTTPPISDERLCDFLSKVESIICPQPASFNAGGMAMFSSLDSLPSVCEPTPIDTHSAVFVQNVPLAEAPWHNDEKFLNSLKNLVTETPTFVTETDTAPQPCLPFYSSTDSELMGKLKRSRAHFLLSVANESFSSHIQPAAVTRDHSNKRRRLTSQTSTSTVAADIPSCASSSEASDSAIRSSHIEQWNQRYSQLVEFQNEFKHCLVPLNWPRNPSLAHWVKRQRYQCRIKREGKHSTMTDERQAALENLGFVWDSHAAAWEERWNELNEFKSRHGHTNVPKKYPENPQLAVWVKCQRRQFKLYSDRQSSNITPERIQRLASLGFVFNPRMNNRFTYI